MLKLYRASQLHDEIKLEKGIVFERGKFDTGSSVNSYGVIEANGIHMVDEPKKVLYEYQDLNIERYKNFPREDGFLNHFFFNSPHTSESIKKYIEDHNILNTEEDYERYGLNDEAILLFTSNVSLKFNKENSEFIKQVFGRVIGTSGYILLPNANFKMGITSYGSEKDENYEDYEVIQSNGLGKQLYLVKKDR